MTSTKAAIAWRPVVGYEGRYEVNSAGQIRTLLNFRPGIILKPIVNKGYHRVKLCYHGKITSHFVHRVVAKAFLPNPESKPQVNHINGIPSDNRLENLEWSTPSENQRHRFEVLRQPTWNAGLHTRQKLNTTLASDIKRLLRKGTTQAVLSKQYGVSMNTISAIKNGKAWRLAE